MNLNFSPWTQNCSVCADQRVPPGCKYKRIWKFTFVTRTQFLSLIINKNTKKNITSTSQALIIKFPLSWKPVCRHAQLDLISQRSNLNRVSEPPIAGSTCAPWLKSRNHEYIIDWIFHSQGLMSFYGWGVMKYVETLEPGLTKELHLCHKLRFLIPLSLQPNVVDLRYFKLWILLAKLI